MDRRTLYVDQLPQLEDILLQSLNTASAFSDLVGAIVSPHFGNAMNAGVWAPGPYSVGDVPIFGHQFYYSLTNDSTTVVLHTPLALIQPTIYDPEPWTTLSAGTIPQNVIGRLAADVSIDIAFSPGPVSGTTWRNVMIAGRVEILDDDPQGTPFYNSSDPPNPLISVQARSRFARLTFTPFYGAESNTRTTTEPTVTVGWTPLLMLICASPTGEAASIEQTVVPTTYNEYSLTGRKKIVSGAFEGADSTIQSLPWTSANVLAVNVLRDQRTAVFGTLTFLNPNSQSADLTNPLDVYIDTDNSALSAIKMRFGQARFHPRTGEWVTINLMGVIPEGLVELISPTAQSIVLNLRFNIALGPPSAGTGITTVNAVVIPEHYDEDHTQLIFNQIVAIQL